MLGKATKFPQELVKRARERLALINAATHILDLRVPRGNRLHQLRGDREGQLSVSINDPWRICFRFENGDADDVEIVDYH